MIRRVDNLSAEAVRHAPAFARATGSAGEPTFCVSAEHGAHRRDEIQFRRRRTLLGPSPSANLVGLREGHCCVSNLKGAEALSFRALFTGAATMKGEENCPSK